MTDPIVERLRKAVAIDLARDPLVLLAVSGGVDSMVLLDAALAVCSASRLRIGTFDHATGPHSAHAVDVVEYVATNAGVPVAVGKGERRTRPSESAWRDMRMAFLLSVAAEQGSVLCTAHTRDDQVETVLFRELRGAGARGLAGLRAPGNARRPLLDFSRVEIERYANLIGVRWVEDPSNADRAFARNRLRHEILPALRRQTPDIDDSLIQIGERAAEWRRDLEAALEREIEFTVDQKASRLDVPLASLRERDDEVLGVVWPALLARIGITADWRGTRRLVEFTRSGSTSQCIQLSGGWQVFRRRDGFEVRRQTDQAERKGRSALPFVGDRD